MSAPKPLWDRTTTRRERLHRVMVKKRGMRIAHAYDKFTVDDLMLLLARAQVTRIMRGSTETQTVPKSMRDYLTKQGVTVTVNK